ncbi:MAG: outer membrane lipoprotein-sorting protein [Spirochaetales bacterium]|nr:outer membrane lipoprotein-sorting protein [Spirochaetales bacterium]
MKIIQSIIFILLLFCVNQAFSIEIEQILKTSDTVMHPINLQGTFTMTLISANGNKRVIKVEAFQKKKDENREDRLFLFSAPPSVAGTGLLVHSYMDKDEDFMWMYLPAVGKVKRINLGVSGGGYFMGSDFTFSDLISYSSGELDYKALDDTEIDKQECYVIEVRGKTKALQEKYGYSRQIYYIRKSDFVYIKIIFYDMSGDLLKELNVHKVQDLGKYKYPSGIKMENKQTGHVSEILFDSLSSPEDIPDKYFTERYLKK